MLKRHHWIQWGLLGLALALVAVMALGNPWGATSVRGKSAALPLTGELTPDQELAQDLALADTRVQAHTVGRRAEVMGVRTVGDHFPAGVAACANAACWQVEIYNFDDDAAVTALVDPAGRQVVEVLYQPGQHPGLNKRLADRALEIALNDPLVVEELGFQPLQADMAPVDGGLVDSACAAGHLCVAPTFQLGDRILWAVVDLTADELAGIAWTDMTPDPPGVSTPFVPEGGCPPSGAVGRDGWVVAHEVTGTDGLRVYNVSYQGVTVLTSAKLAEWHADYGATGYEDSTGCGGGGGGFPIYPYGLTETRDLLDEDNNYIGFELVQDFRMSNWGAFCNYRYEQHMQFFADGRFRVMSGAYGKGCGSDAIYRPLVRLDVAVDGDDEDTFSYWDGADWVPVTTETWQLQSEPYTADNYKWRILDASGFGYYLEPGVGQFEPGSDPDNAFIYVVRHYPNEGDTDLGVIGDCCLDNYQQGPHIYLNNESVENTNIVVWYVAQLVTDAAAPDYYCWTVTGDPNPETYPCWSGPMFHLNQMAPTAGFVHNGPIQFGQEAQFTNTSLGSQPMTYAWDFGDGLGTSTEEHPRYMYGMDGEYLVTLTATNDFGVSVYTDTLAVEYPPQAGFTHSGPVALGEAVSFTNSSVGGEPLTFAWDFGDGVGTSMEANPTYTYSAEGDYLVSLTVSNRWGSDVFTATVTILYPAQAAFTHDGPALVGELIQFTNLSAGGEPLTYVWEFGDGATSTLRDPAHLYADHGPYVVSLTAINPYSTATATATVEVQFPPTAAFTFTPDPYVHQAVSFTNLTLGAEPMTYLWDFGDGTTSTEANPTHSYAAAGVYTVTLTAANMYDSAVMMSEVVVRAYQQFLPTVVR